MTPPNDPAVQTPSYYHLEPFPDRSTTVMGTPSTDKGEVVMQPSIHSGIYTGLGTRSDVPQGPWNPTGSGKRILTSSMSMPLTISYRYEW